MKYDVFCNTNTPSYINAMYKKSFPDFNTALRYAKANGGRVYCVETRKRVADCTRKEA